MWWVCAAKHAAASAYRVAAVRHTLVLIVRVCIKHMFQDNKMCEEKKLAMQEEKKPLRHSCNYSSEVRL